MARDTVLLALDPRHFPTLIHARQALEPGQKHPEPVLAPRPGQWDGTRCKVYGTVLFDPAERLFKMWYSGGTDTPDAVRRQDGSTRHIGYAFSEDGLRWRRPSLGLIEHHGSRDNNLIHLDAQAPNVFLSEDEPDPNKRFLLITEAGLDTRHVKLLHSRDGVNWKQAPRAPIEVDEANHKRAHEPFSILFDPHDPDPARRWKGYSLLHVYRDAYLGRAVGFFTAREPDRWVEWPTQPIMSAADGIESEIHLPHVSRFHDTYVMLYDAMEVNHHTQTEVAVSDDGVNFRRVQNGLAVVPNGPPGGVDAGKVCVSPRSLFVHEGRVWWYYTVSPDTYQTGPRGMRGTPWHRYVGLARWREDGFASLRAGAGEQAQVVTRPLRANASGEIRVWLNAISPAEAELSVTLLCVNEVVAVSKRWVGDQLRGEAEWNSPPIVEAGRAYRLRLTWKSEVTCVYAVGLSGTLSLFGRAPGRQGEGQGNSVPAATAAQTSGDKTCKPDPHPNPLPKRERGPDWSFRTGGKISASPTLASDTLFVGSWDARLYALDARTGEPRWKFQTGGVISTRPAVHGDTVYTASRDGHIYAVQAASGRLKWKQPASIGRSTGSANGTWIDSSPTVAPYLPRWDGEPEAPHRLFVGSHNRDLSSLELHDGSRCWSFPTFNWVLSQPAVDEFTVYFGSMDGHVYAIDARIGALKWRYRVGRRVRYAPSVVPGSVVCEAVCGSPLVHDGAVYIGADDGCLYALDAETGDERWVCQTGKWVWGRPAWIDGVLVFASADGHAYGVDAGAGEPRWRSALPAPSYADVVRLNGNAVIAALDGSVLMIEPRDGSVRWSHRLAAPLRSAPAVGPEGTLYGADVAGVVTRLTPPWRA